VAEAVAMGKLPVIYAKIWFKLQEKPQWDTHDLGLISRDFRLSEKDVKCICQELSRAKLVKITPNRIKINL